MTPFESARQVSAIQAAQKLGLPLRRTGPRYVTRCVFHEEKSPSMTLYPGTGGFYCFGCHEHGDAARLYQQVLGLAPVEAAKRVCQDFGLSYDRRRRHAPSAPKADARVLRQKIIGFREREIQKLVVTRTQMALKMAERENEMAKAALPPDACWDDPEWAQAMKEHAECEEAIRLLDGMGMSRLWEMMQNTKEENNGSANGK